MLTNASLMQEVDVPSMMHYFQCFWETIESSSPMLNLEGQEGTLACFYCTSSPMIVSLWPIAFYAQASHYVPAFPPFIQGRGSFSNR